MDDKEKKDSEKDRGSDNEKQRWQIGDVVRELTATGLAALFMTEDTLRNLLREKNLPKELVSLLLDTFTKRKDDLYGVIAKEFGRVLSKIDVSAEVGKFLERHKVHLEAKISFEPKENGKKNDSPRKETT